MLGRPWQQQHDNRFDDVVTWCIVGVYFYNQTRLRGAIPV